jgi:hypothetical protein
MVPSPVLPVKVPADCSTAAGGPGSALKRTDHRAGTRSEIRQTASAPKVAMKTKSPATGINSHLAWKTLLSMMRPPEKPSGSTAL